MNHKLIKSLFGSLILFLASNISWAVAIKNDFRVNTDSTNWRQIAPQISFDSARNFVIVYGDRGGPLSNEWPQTYFQRFDSLGNRLGEPVHIGNLQIKNYEPTVAMHPDGHFAIAWAGGIQVPPKAQFQEDVWLQVFDADGSPLTGIEQVDIDRPLVTEDELALDMQPSIGVDSVGNLVVVWAGQDSQYGQAIWGQLFNSEGTRIGQNFRVSDPAGASLPFTPLSQFPHVKVHTDGRWIVAWTGWILSFNMTAVARIYNADGSPRTPMISLIQPGGWFGFASYPFVDFLPDGKYAFVFNGNDSNFSYPYNAVYTQIFDSLINPVTSHRMVNDVADLGNVWHRPYVATADDGSYVALWSDMRSGVGCRDLWAQRFDAEGNPMGVNYRVNSITGSLGCYDPAQWFDDWLDIDGDKVGLTWTDFRNLSSLQTDVYAKLMRLEDIGIYIPGDLDMNSQLTLADVIMLVNYLFKGTYHLYPLSPADVNADCKVSLADVISMVNYLFRQPWELQEGCAD